MRIFLIACVSSLLGYFFYARLVKKIFGVEQSHKAPAIFLYKKVKTTVK